MDSLRRELARLREQAGGKSVMLNDGTRYRYSRDEVSIRLFVHAAAMEADYQREPRPACPEILQAVARARDRRAAVSQLYPEWPTKQPLCAYDLLALVETGELVPQQFAPGFPVVDEAGDSGRNARLRR